MWPTVSAKSTHEKAVTEHALALIQGVRVRSRSLGRTRELSNELLRRADLVFVALLVLYVLSVEVPSGKTVAAIDIQQDAREDPNLRRLQTGQDRSRQPEESANAGHECGHRARSAHRSSAAQEVGKG